MHEDADSEDYESPDEEEQFPEELDGFDSDGLVEWYAPWDWAVLSAAAGSETRAR